MYFQQQQMLQGSYPSSGTPVPTAAGGEPGRDGATASSPAQQPQPQPQPQMQQLPQIPPQQMLQAQMPNFGALCKGQMVTALQSRSTAYHVILQVQIWGIMRGVGTVL